MALPSPPASPQVGSKSGGTLSTATIAKSPLDFNVIETNSYMSIQRTACRLFVIKHVYIRPMPLTSLAYATVEQELRKRETKQFCSVLSALSETITPVFSCIGRKTLDSGYIILAYRLTTPISAKPNVTEADIYRALGVERGYGGLRDDSTDDRFGVIRTLAQINNGIRRTIPPPPPSPPTPTLRADASPFVPIHIPSSKFKYCLPRLDFRVPQYPRPPRRVPTAAVGFVSNSKNQVHVAKAIRPMTRSLLVQVQPKGNKAIPIISPKAANIENDSEDGGKTQKVRVKVKSAGTVMEKVATNTRAILGEKQQQHKIQKKVGNTGSSSGHGTLRRKNNQENEAPKRW